MEPAETAEPEILEIPELLEIKEIHQNLRNPRKPGYPKNPAINEKQEIPGIPDFSEILNEAMSKEMLPRTAADADCTVYAEVGAHQVQSY